MSPRRREALTKRRRWTSSESPGGAGAGAGGAGAEEGSEESKICLTV